MALRGMRTLGLSAMHRTVRDSESAIGAAGDRREIDLAIHRALGSVARRSGARHAYVCEFRDGRRRLFTTHERCAPGVESHADLDLHPGMVSDWTRSLPGGGARQAGGGRDDPRDGGPPRLFITGRQEGSIVVPLRVGGDLVGFMCLDYVRRSCVPSPAELDVIAMLADSVALATFQGRRST
jgi:hypothetical protein